MTCCVEGCNNPILNGKRKLCSAHYARFRKHGDPTGGGPSKVKPESDSCTISGCDKKHYALGLCLAHYTRNYRHGSPLSVRRTPPGEPLAFIHHAIEMNSDECIFWPFASDANGRACVTYEGRQRSAGAVVCEIAHGKSRGNQKHAAHSCGNGHLGCINPNHLRWATVSENHADRWKHSTMLLGEQSPVSKLTEDQAREVKRLKGKQFGRLVAERFGITPSAVYAIWSGKNWAWLK